MAPQLFVELVEEMKGELPVRTICQLFGIAKSTYYRWKKQSFKSGLTDTEELIQKVCVEHRFTYGYRRVSEVIRRTQIINKNTVQKIMQKYGWNCRVKVKKIKRIGKVHKICDNILNRNFKSEERFKKLVTDITYLPFGSKMMYLSSIMDLYNGEIVAYSISDKQDVNFVLDTLKQLPEVNDCILHSDQGSVYTSYTYQQEVTKRGITMSMSRKGTPADNACIESFHSSLKSETFYLDRLNNEPTSIVIQIVIDYIKYYNKTRIQQKLGYKSPIEYRQSVTQ